MKIDFNDGSFLQIEDDADVINFIQCIKKDKKITMMTSRLNKKQAEQLLTFIEAWIKR